ncbi:AraC family transcriptional regulator [Clostridiales bacterium TF09-2AC]|uniref:AraC family transcriptional regulator n=1 Tax=Enterocloster hominis (ex Hitch et al. 2024) TaxID=1917870 RepID=UPI000E72BEF7|nr:AraC family transcriptional regulator [Clostridiales bacterium TF09-2AC]
MHGSDSVQTIPAFISGHYSEPLTIDRIAREISLSSSECCRLFKRKLGTTPLQYRKSAFS